MINKLDNSHTEVANRIYSIFQSSYKIEAQLIGTLNFPPLLRSVKDIAGSKSLFYGFFENTCLAAVLEVAIYDDQLDINSLTVAPNSFRRGIVDKLLKYVLSTFDFDKAFVETALVNEPAIRLYKKHGFIEVKQWTPSHGIKKILFEIKKA
ncbi:MAG: GNAT family N-acetyltransferase [Gammaproteobacteria bacterium]|nr:GNAT family N-acetyltransferase [Gammaproteobacteria bacterium]